MLLFVFIRSSRLIPGLRAIPAVMTTMSEFEVSLYPFDPTTRTSVFFDGRGLDDIECLPLRNPLDDVNEDDFVRELLVDETLRCCGAEVPCADDGDLHADSSEFFLRVGG